jgi:hypothetical protein
MPSSGTPHLSIVVQHLPGLVKQVCVEAVRRNVHTAQLVLDLLIAHHADAVVQVVKKDRLGTGL